VSDFGEGEPIEGRLTMKLITRAAIAASAFTAAALAGAPAFSQTVMLNYSFPEMRQRLEEIKSTVKNEGETADKIHYLEAVTSEGLIYGVYGLECDSKEATQRCRGAEMIASFDFQRPAEVAEAMEVIDYAAVADYKGSDGKLKLSRYVIFDNGITPANLKTNLEVFTSIAHKVWDMPDEEGYFDK
jgi:hypothetical protein